MKSQLLLRLRRVRRACSLILTVALVSQSLVPVALAQPAPAAAREMQTATARAPRTDAAMQVVLHPLATPFHGCGAIAHQAAMNALLVSAYEPTGQPYDLELIGADGAHRRFSNLNGVAGELLVATARDAGHGTSLGGFAPGTAFVGTSAAGVLARITPDGAALQNPWVTLPGTSSAITGLTVDTSGMFGGDVLAATQEGDLWRIAATGAATRVAAIGVPVGALATIPNDTARYGPWAGRVLAAAKAQPLLYAIDPQGRSATFPAAVGVRDIALIPAHENFFGIDPEAGQLVGAPADAFAAMVGDVVLAQKSPGILTRVRWNGTELEASAIAQTTSWSHIAFSPAGVGDVAPAPRLYDRLAVVRHAPSLDSGRIEGALWQLAGEDVVLDGNDVVTSDLLVPGSPRVVAATGAAFGGVVEGTGSREPSSYAVSVGAKATLGHLITRTDPIELAPIAAPPAAAGTRDVSLQSATDAIGPIATLRNLSLSGKAGVVAVPPGTYGAFAASGRTTLQLGVAGSSGPAVYNLDSLNLAGGSELRINGAVVLNVRGSVTMVGATAGNADAPSRLIVNVATGEVRLSGNSVLYAIVHAPQSPATIEGNGRLRGTVTADRLTITGNGVLQVTENGVPAPPINRAPVVDAGADQTITFPVDSVSLNASVADDDLPAGAALTLAWTASGPAPVRFSAPSAASTTAQFTQPGIYTLHLTASDSLLSTSDDVVVIVVAQNQPPVVDAGIDQTVTLPGTAALRGSASDDGLPTGAALQYAWSRVSGPGDVTFASAAAQATTAAFATAGVYTLRLTVSDGALSASDDVAVTVLSANTAPVVNAGIDVIAIHDGNLLVNGSGDAPLRSSGTVPGWRSAAPNTWKPVVTGTPGFPASAEGTSLLVDGGGTDELTQDVDVSLFAPAIAAGSQRFEFSGFVRSGAEAVADTARVIVEYRDAANGALLDTFDSGAIASTDGWMRIRNQRAAPAGTRSIRVRLLAARNSGATTDAFFDGLSLRAIGAGAVLLHGGAIDDHGPIAYRWTTVSGPAPVLLGDAASASTPVVFRAPGLYTLRLTASDPELSSSDDVVVTVVSADHPPVVDAGADVAVGLPSDATLRGSVDDDDSAPASEWTFLSGPAVPVIAAPAQLTTSVSFSAPGPYVFRLRGSDASSSIYDEVTVTVTAANRPPSVDAGADQTLRLPAIATLHAAASDDGNPAGSSLALTWSVVQGPGAVAFADAHAATTTATFSAAGNYVLRTTVSDSQLEASDDVAIAVLAANAAPVVTAAVDSSSITLPAIATLTGTATDDGVPAPLTVSWSMVSGPAAVTFATPSQRATTATFSAAGVYVLRFTASDRELAASADVTVNVLAARINQPPAVSAGPSQSIAFGMAATLAGRIGDDGLPAGGALTASWSMVSGPGVAAFGDPTLAATTATFTIAGTYVLRLTANDGELRASDDVTVVVKRTAVANFTVGGTPRNVAIATNDVASFWQGTQVVSESNELGPAYAAVSAIDDDPSTGWRTSYGQNTNQSFTLLLYGDEPRTFDRVRIVNGFSGLGVGRFHVDCSTTTNDDSAFHTILSGTLSEADRVQEFVLPARASARFLRFIALDNHGNGQLWLRSFEAIAGDRPGIASYDIGGDLAGSAVGGTVVATSGDGSVAPRLFDGNAGTVYAMGLDGAVPPYVTVQLAQSTTVDRVRLTNWAEGRGLKRFRVSVSATDLQNFTTVLEATAAAGNTPQEFVFPAGAIPAAYVRLEMLDAQDSPFTVGLAEFQVIASGARVHISSYGGSALTPEAMFDEAGVTYWSAVPGPAAPCAIVRTGGSDTPLVDRVTLLGWGDARDSVVRDFEVLVSDTTDDAAAFRSVLAATNLNNGQQQTFVFPGGAVRARFVKLVAKNNYGALDETRIATFAVLTAANEGSLLSAPLPAPAPGTDIVASSSRSNAPARNAFDGDPWSGWAAADGQLTNQWIRISFPNGAIHRISGVGITPNGGAGPKNFEIRVSTTTTDQAAFTTVYSGVGPLSGSREYPFDRDVEARYVEFFFRDGNATDMLSVNELRVSTLASEGSTVRSLSSSVDPGFVPSMLIDDATNDSAFWTTANGRVAGESAVIALPSAGPWLIDRVALQSAVGYAAAAPREFDVEVADVAGGPYTRVFRGVLRPNAILQHFFFPAASARYVRLVVRSNYGAPNVILRTFWILSPQVGALQARFVDTTERGDADLASYAWDFGDGTSSGARDPLHTFAAAGTYDVRLTVVDADSHASSRTIPYTAAGAWSSDFSFAPSSPEEGSAIAFAGIAPDALAPLAENSWSWGDGSATTLNASSASHAYADNGTYSVTHATRTARGTTASTTKNVVVVDARPTIATGDVAGRWGTELRVGTTVNDPGPADLATLRCSADFGDGQTGQSENCRVTGLAHSYPAPGVYHATATVTDKDGESAASTFTATIAKRPTISVCNAPGVVAGQPVTLTGTLRDAVSHLLIPNEPVGFQVGLQSVPAVTDASGVAHATVVPDASFDASAISLSFAGDDLYLPSVSCPSQQRPLDLALVVDVSSSMEPVFTDAKAAFRQLLGGLNPAQDQVAVVSFAEFANVLQPLTHDFAAAAAAGDRLQAAGGTIIAAGLDAARLQLTGPNRNPLAKPVIILLSDGGDGAGSYDQAALAARNAGIRIVAVAMQTPDFRADVMKAVASSIEDYYYVRQPADLEGVYASLEETLCTPSNRAPVVTAGANQTVLLSQGSAALHGSVVDDGLPEGAALTRQWSVASGPAAVTFANAASAETTASFTASGTYVLRLTASDTQFTAFAETTVVVVGANAAPIVSAGADQSIALEAQLLRNGDADEGLGAWAAVSGSWSAPSNGDAGQPPALRGGRLFATASDAAELRQDVDVSAFAAAIDAGSQRFAWSAWTRSANAPLSDTARVIVEYRTAPDGAPLLIVDSGASSSPAFWSEVADGNVAPAGTRTIRVRLLAARRGGATNGVWFDAVSLRALGAAGVVLAGTATDDGVPSPALTTSWSQVSGPASVSLGAASSATFSAAGSYVLRFTADDSLTQASDDVAVTVAAANVAPAVDAGAARTITLPSTAALAPVVTDDGAPGALRFTWFQIAGPAAVSFSDVHALHPTVAFPAAGAYKLRLLADDGDRIVAGDVAIAVEAAPENRAPVVDAGADQTILDPVRTATLAGSATDDGLPQAASLTYRWTQISGPATATIAAAASASTAVSLPVFGSYTFRLAVSDSLLTATDDLTITLDGVNAAPVVRAGADRRVAANAPIALAGTVTDDGLPIGGALTIAWSKVSGPGSVAFADPSSASTTVTFGDVGTYLLRLTASDSSQTSTAEVTFTVVPATQGPVVAITSPEGGQTITDRATIRGSVSAGAAWRLELRPNGDSTVAPREPGRTIASGDGPLTDAVLGTVDPTLLHNGAYAVRLVATDSTGQTAASAISLLIDGKLKVGVFTLRYRDLAVPLAGPNIDVLRTYDSRDRQSSDFGYGWSLSFTRVHLDKSGVLGEGWQETLTGGIFDTVYCLQPLAPKIVTVTLPDERTYRFRMTVSPACQAIAPIETPSIHFEPLPGTRARLETVGAETDGIVNGSKPGDVTIVTSNAETYNPAKFRLILPNGSAMVIDEANGLQTFTDRNGNTLTFTRDGIEHSTGEGVHFTRDAAGRITAITDPAGKQIVYGYDERGDLRSVTNQENATTRFVYDDAHGLIEVYDPAGRRGIRSEYDESGRLVRVLDADGKPVALSYDPDARQETVIDRNGRTWIYAYDPRGMLLGIAGPHGAGERATYDDEGRCLTSTDRSGRTARFTYDAAGNLISMVDRSGGTSTLAYDSSNRLVSITDPKNRTTTREYDANGNLAALTDSTGSRITYGYDARGNLTSVTDPDQRARTYGYDARGRRTSETDTNGGVTRYAYDLSGRRTTTTLPDRSVIVDRYDATGRHIGTVGPTGETTSSIDDDSTATYTFTDALQNRTQSATNAEGLPSGVTFADDSSMGIEYDANGNVERSTWSSGVTAAVERDDADAPAKITVNGAATWQFAKDAAETTTTQIDPRGHATTTTFDALGRVGAVVDAQQRQRTFGYDAAGNLTSVTDAANRTLAFELDAFDRVRRTTSPNGESTSVAYDWRGNVTAVTDPLQRVTGYGYDVAGELVSVTEPNRSVSTVERNSIGAITAATNALGETTHYEYDAMGRRTKKIWPDGSSEQFTYLAGQLVSTITRRDGSVESYEYDAMGRPTTIRRGGDVVSVTYTAGGRRDVVSSARGSIDYDYDAFGRLVAAHSANGVMLQYAYDLAGNRTSITSPAGTTTFTYDSLNRLATVTDPHGHVTSYEYDLAGNLLATTFPNGVRAQNSYDEVGQVVAIVATDRNGAVLFDERYERQAGGAIRRTVHGDGSSVAYDYDDVSRLVAEAWSDGRGNVVRWIDYGYDATGNRIVMSDSTSGTSSYTYDAHHLVMTGDGHESYAYDGRGNVASTGSETAADRYSYDAAGHLVKIAFRAGGEQTYAYDSAGNRVRVVDAAGKAVNEIVDGADGRLVAEMDDAQQLRAAYTYGHGLISESVGGEEYYYIRDASGSVRALTNAGGAITDTYDYTAFGVLSASTGSTPNPFRYTGQQFDGATGLYFLHARDYKPAIGRFLQSDSYEGDLRHPQSANAYAYANGDPVNNVDPTGHSSLPAWLGGIYAHEAIGLYYIAQHGDYFWFRLDRDSNKNVPAALLPDGYGWGASNREILNLPEGAMAKKLGLPGLRPDLRHYLTGDVYEIKPYSAAYMVQAWREAADYVRTLNEREPFDADGQWIPWHNGNETMPGLLSLPSLEVRSYPFAVEGATLYTTNLREAVREFIDEMTRHLAKKAFKKAMEELNEGAEAAAEGAEAAAEGTEVAAIADAPSAITAGAQLENVLGNATSAIAGEASVDAQLLVGQTGEATALASMGID